MPKHKNPTSSTFLLSILSGGAFGLARTKVAKFLARLVIIFFILSYVGGVAMELLGFERDNLIILAVTIVILIGRFFYNRRK